jgi:eukaryotic-like serine/threonine-protein kinase
MSSEHSSDVKFEIGHVLFIDIVGYSKLLITEQSKQIQKLKEVVRGTEQVRIAEVESKLLRLPTGDGGALVFRNSLEASVLCALEIARALKGHHELRVRMGIHSGPVNEITDLNAQANIAGAGINVAQRVMDCGDAGHILLSKRVADDLEHYPRWLAYLHDLGECEVKHGHKLSLVNFYDGEIGNREVPQKFRQAKRAEAKKVWKIAALIVLVILLIAGGIFYRSHHTKVLSDKDTIVLADFSNTTNDPVFDGTLRQGLGSQLEQSPFLSLISDQRIAQTLALMSQPKDARLTSELARQVGQRIGSAASIEGSISMLGSEYVVGLKAVNCRNGDLLAQEQVTANGKEQVLKALGQAASSLRRKLGESLASIQKYDALPEDVTTPSLEALQAYSLGIKAFDVTNDLVAAVPFFQRASTLDPNFAMAYLRMAECYQPQGEMAVAAEYARKAYQLRDRTSDREKLHISTFYEYVVTGNLEATRKACDLFAQTYSRDEDAQLYLWLVYAGLGDYEKAHRAAQEAFRINPASGNNLVNLMYADQWLNRLAEARSTLQDARAHHVDSPWIALIVYTLDFLQHEGVDMDRQAAAAMGIPGIEDQMLFLESETAACGGEFTKARELTRRAMDSARRAQEKETAAEYLGHNAVKEAIVGNFAVAKEDAQSAIAEINGKNAGGFSAVAFALTGDAANANRLIDDLGKRFSQDTFVQFDYLPMARASLALTAGNAGDAVKALAVASPYELGHTNNDFTFALYPVYLRGESYLAAKDGSAAITEFQKILDHSGVIGNEPIGALAHLGLGRAYALSGDSAKAKTAYQDFFALWKNADPDVPILKEAKTEYAQLP